LGLTVTLLSELTPILFISFIVFDLASTFIQVWKYKICQQTQEFLTDFRFMNHQKFYPFFWYHHRMRLWILGGGHGGHFWHSRMASAQKTHFEAYGTGVPFGNVTVNFISFKPSWFGFWARGQWCSAEWSLKWL